MHAEEPAVRLWRGKVQRMPVILSVNYPGSTYTIIYDPEKDRFEGYYYQSVQKQTFEGIYERTK